MATITIRDLPDAVHARLKKQARLHRRSLNQEVVALLAGDIAPAPVDKTAEAKAFIRKIDALHKEIGWEMSSDPKLDPVHMIRKMRDSR